MNDHNSSIKEQVLCFPVSIIKDNRNYFYDANLFIDILNNICVLNKSEAENNYKYKQLIVYVVIKYDDQYLGYQRTEKSDENRLRTKISIGIGGHININDKQQLTLFTDTNSEKEVFIQEAARREINEELKLGTTEDKDIRILGFINDNTDDVGKVHFGIVCMLAVDKKTIKGKFERGISKVVFYTKKELNENIEYMENWSKILITEINGGSI
jgi:predicted NUDIX family phosphoesterase